MVESLKGKRILFLSPAFFSYEKHIVNEMNKLGANVSYYDERSVTKPMHRALLKIAPRIFEKKTKKYYNNIINKTKNVDFDIILIVRADMILEESISELRLSNPKAKIVLYLWDSIKNVVGIQNKIGLFDEAYTFDRKDAINNKNLKFRPLFYLPKFSKQVDTQKKYKYKMCFIGTIHSDRWGILEKLKTQVASLNGRVFLYPYLQSSFIFYVYKILKKDFRTARRNMFKYKPMDVDELVNVENDSEIVVDIQHPRQSGLTIRTIEMLGMQKKLITTNEEIQYYDFFDPHNVLIIDRKSPLIDEKFLQSEFRKTPRDIYDKYSIDAWILEILK